MVENRIRRYGLDVTERRYRLAGRTVQAGRAIVDCLEEFRREETSSPQLESESTLYFSVPEKEAIIKKIRVPVNNGLDRDKLARYEFEASLLDNPDNYFIDTCVPNGGEDYFIIGYHREIIARRVNLLENKFILPDSQRGFRLRGWSLAQGYLNFCWKEGGELVAVVDISDDCTSFCFICHDHPVRFGHIGGFPIDNSSNEGISPHYLADLVTTLRYQQTVLAADGCTVPLSLLVLTGASASPYLAGLIEEKMRVRTSMPSLKMALFAPEIAESAGRYLTSLGLTVA